MNLWEARLEPIDITPVRCHPLSVEKAGSGQHKHTGTNRYQTNAASVRRPEFAGQGFRWSFVRISPPRNDNRARMPQSTKTRRTLNCDAAHPADWPRLHRTNRKLVPLHRE